MNIYTLNNGVQIPAIGLGASAITDTLSPCMQISTVSLQKNIYCFSAQTYPGLLYDISADFGKSEKILGEVFAQIKGTSRPIFSVRLSNTEQKTKNIRRAVEEHLNILQTDHIDLLSLGWPYPDYFVETYHQIEELYLEGIVKAIGVANFHQHHLETLMQSATVIPAVNQIEVHPLFIQKPLIDYCKSLGIRIMAYAPLGRMHDVLIKNRTLRTLAEKHHKTVPQIILRWQIERGLLPIPRTTNSAHLSELMNIFDFHLTNAEIKSINDINENIRLRFNPDTVDYTNI